MTFFAHAVASAAGLLSHLGVAILSGGLFIAAVALVCRLAPRMPATLRCGLWWLAALKLLIGLAWVEPLRLPLLPAALAPRETLASGPSSVSAPRWVAAAPVAGILSVQSVPVQRASGAAGIARASAAAGPLWKAALAFLWLFGVAFHLAHLGRGVWRGRGLVRRAAPVRQPALTGLFARLAALVGLRRRPGLKASSEVETPQALGGIRPLILLPSLRLPNLSPSEIEMTLCHELLHVRRGDLWLAWVPALAQRIFFFFPPAAWAAREYLVAREAACDAEVLRVLGSAPQAYGRLLLRWGVAPRETGLAAAGASSSLVNLKRRLQMLHETSDSSRRPGARWWLLGALALAGVLPVTLVVQARAPKAKPAAHAIPAPRATPAPETPVVAPAAPAVDENAAEPAEPTEAAEAAEVTPPPAAEADEPEPEAEPEEAEAADPEDSPSPPPAPRSPHAPRAPRPEASTPPPGARAPLPPHFRYRPGVTAPTPPAPPAALAPRAATPPPGPPPVPGTPPPVPGAPPARAPRAVAPTTPLPPLPPGPARAPLPPGRAPRAATPPVPAIAGGQPYPGVPPSAPRVWAPGVPGRTPVALARAVPPAPPAPPSPPAPPVPAKHGRGHSSSLWYNTDGENSWVYLSGENTSMSGSSSDLEEVKRLRGRDQGDLLWFKRDGKAYVVRDAATLQRVKEIWRPVGELGAQQGKLGAQQGKLGAEQGKLGAQQGGLGAQQGKLGAQQGVLGARQGALAARQARSGERDEASLEKESAAIDRDMEELSRQQEDLGRKQEALGRQQEVLGRQQEALGRKQEEASRKAETELRQLMDEAVRSGSAQPVR
jgi:beta-lactamase regulating signal transducer with metallopeptidase domain